MELLPFIVKQTVNNLSATQETQVQSLGQEDPLEKGMATNSMLSHSPLLLHELEPIQD